VLSLCLWQRKVLYQICSKANRANCISIISKSYYTTVAMIMLVFLKLQERKIKTNHLHISYHSIFSNKNKIKTKIPYYLKNMPTNYLSHQLTDTNYKLIIYPIKEQVKPRAHEKNLFLQLSHMITYSISSFSKRILVQLMTG
jgi:hypothetical protein